jgi:hypothetical protein
VGRIGIGGRALRAILFVFLFAAPCCYAEATGTIPPPDYAYGYAPVYYDGYVVDYDDGGRPFYYVNGAVVWVPPTAPLFAGLFAHGRAFGPAYRNWHANVGSRYQGYRFHGHAR